MVAKLLKKSRGAHMSGGQQVDDSVKNTKMSQLRGLRTSSSMLDLSSARSSTKSSLGHALVVYYHLSISLKLCVDSLYAVTRLRPLRLSTRPVRRALGLIR